MISRRSDRRSRRPRATPAQQPHQGCTGNGPISGPEPGRADDVPKGQAIATQRSVHATWMPSRVSELSMKVSPIERMAAFIAALTVQDQGPAEPAMELSEEETEALRALGYVE